MKHLDTLLDELQHPVAQLMDWCKEDQDRAIVACWKDMSENEKLDVVGEFAEHKPWEIVDNITEEIGFAESENYKPRIDYESLYLPLEHIINDRIEVYNKS